MTRTVWIRALASSLLLAGAMGQRGEAADDSPIEAIQARTEIPEELLLDVGIRVFDPGLPEDEEELHELERNGVYPDVRKSEARYIPIHLKRTLESTGHWGAVRLVPSANVIDVTLWGVIQKSNGKKLELDLYATDATGKVWFKEDYKREADVAAYGKEATARDPYQSLYNEIANDLLEARGKLDEEDIHKIRTIARLKFAQDLAPTAFGDYLTVKRGRYDIDKLPAHDDPMMERLARIRERDHMFIDTLNEYYADFYSQMEEPYDSWRAYSYEEQVALEKLQRAAKWEKVLGAAAIFGGVVASTSRSRSGRAAGEAAILGGMAAFGDGIQKSEEAKMHREALHELAQSFDSEVAPMLIEMEGEVLRLTGSVETQYTKWRQLLRRIFAAETGLPLDPNDPAVATEEISKN